MEPWQQEVMRQFSDSITFLSFDGLFCLFVELCWDWQTAGSRNRGSRSWGSSLTASFSGYEEHVFQLDELAGLSQCDLVPPVFCMWWIQFPIHSAHSIQVSAVAGAAGPLQTMILWKPTLVSPFLCSILFGLSAVYISTCDGAFVDMFFVGLVADLLNLYVLPVVFTQFLMLLILVL